MLKNISKRLGREKIQGVDIQFAKSIHVPARRLIIFFAADVFISVLQTTLYF